VQSQQPAGELKRQLGLFDATMVNVGTVLASGIFLVPATIALQVSASGPNLAIWLVGGVLAMFGAFTLAELSAAMPHTGGLFVYLEKAFSPLWGFLYGWTLFLVIQTGTIAALGVAFAVYLGHFWPLTDLGIKLVAVASIIVLTALNARGVRLGVWTLNLLTVVKVGIILIVLGWALKPGTLQAENFAPLWPTEWDFGATKLWGLALIGVLWAYDGWVDVTLVAGEVKDPQKNLHRSLVLSMVIIIVIYLLLNLAYIAVLSVAGMAGRLLVAADFATKVMGAIGAGFVAFLVMISCLGANNGFVFTGPRVYYAMAREGLFFKGVDRLHPVYKTPVYSLLLQGLWACLLVFLMGTYEELFTSVVFASWVFYALAAAGVIVLRRKHPEWKRPYLCWGYPWVPIVFVIAAIALIANTFAADVRSSVIGTVLMSSGLPAYWFWNRRRKHAPEAVR
jgi:APA family basic amino acid/polyamine antiporter